MLVVIFDQARVSRLINKRFAWNPENSSILFQVRDPTFATVLSAPQLNKKSLSLSEESKLSNVFANKLTFLGALAKVR